MRKDDSLERKVEWNSKLQREKRDHSQRENKESIKNEKEEVELCVLANEEIFNSTFYRSHKSTVKNVAYIDIDYIFHCRLM